jgi:proline iminopeptidase
MYAIEHLVLGHSFGGYAALSFALRHPERLGDLILLATSPVGNHGSDLDCLERMAGIELREVMARFDVDQGTEEDLRRFDEELVPLYCYPPKPEIMELPQSNPFFYIEIWDQMYERVQKNYNVRSQLPSINCPTLVLHGRYD